MVDEITDLKFRLAAAETDKKFAEVLGEIRTISADLSGRMTAVQDASRGTKTTVMVTGLAVAALMVGILTYGQAWFGIGVSTRDVVKSAVSEYLLQHPTTDLRGGAS